MLKRFFTICLFALSPTVALLAQQDAVFAHYWAMEPSFNPGAVGKEEVINVNGAYNMTLVGFENNPRTMYVGADMPLYMLHSYHGVGVQLLNDQLGLFSHQRLFLQYAYKFKLFGGTLSTGVQFGLLSEKFKGSAVDLEQTGDPAFTTTDATGVAIDLSAGLYYKHRNWYAGVSATHLTAPSIELGDRSILDVSRAYYLTGGYNIKLKNPFLTIHPSVLARTDFTTYRVDVTARVKYTHENKMLYAGVAYSPNNSVTALIGGNFHGISLGYAYEYYTAKLKFGNGSHELFVSYQTKINLYKRGRNRHQSVRIL